MSAIFSNDASCSLLSQYQDLFGHTYFVGHAWKIEAYPNHAEVNHCESCLNVASAASMHARYDSSSCFSSKAASLGQRSHTGSRGAAPLDLGAVA